MKHLLLGLGWFPDDRGGAERYFRELLESLRAAGESVSAVVVGFTSGPGRGVVSVSAGDGLVRRLRRFERLAARLAPDADLVDIHFALYAFLPCLLGRFRRKPSVVHFHGPWAEESAFARNASPVMVRMKRTVERAVYRRADTVITLSSAFRRILVERYGVSPWTIDVIPPGVDLERFCPGDRAAARAALDIPTGTRVVCCVRRLTPRTGVDVLLRAWARLEGERLLLIAGEGGERATLERLARELGINDSVRFLGAVSEQRLVKLYRAADASVVPSLALEGFGLVVLESLACGTPVIASDVGGLRETLAALRPRCVVPAGDADALAARLADPLPQANACRALAEQYSWERAVERHRRVYQRVSSASPTGPLRVVYLDHTARLSGGELALLRLLPALEDVQAHVVLAEDGPLVGRLLEAGVSVEVMPLGRRAGSLSRTRVGSTSLTSVEAVQSALYSFRLALRLRRLRPDLVHTNSLKAAYYGGLAARMCRLPLVTHVHDRLADDYLPPRAAALTRSLLARLPQAVVAPSEAVGQTVGRGVAVIPCASEPVPDRRRSRNGALTVGMLGRIAPWKGQHVFLEAFARAFGEGGERAVLIGAPLFGPEEQRYFLELQATAQRLGLGGRVRFTGFVDDPTAEIANLDVLVHASVIPEPFGQVVVEGMAAGLAVVAPNVGGPAEIIDDESTGLLYAPGDERALASCLERLACDPELRARLGVAARVKARQYEPAAIASRIRRVYEEVLALRSGHVPSALDESETA